jgi:glycosyltransferase involved in cell wall biosynthesis
MNSTTLPEDPQQLQRLRETLLEWTAAQHGGVGLTSAERYAALAGLLGPELCRKLGVYRIPEGFKLSVVIPVYNEVKTLETVLTRVRAAAIPCEIICVDDGSRDGTRDLLTRLAEQPQPQGSPLKVILHEKNQGKGAAIKTGFLQVSGDVVVIQDADMEYDPQDFRMLLQPILADEADVAYGSRFSHNDGPILHFWHTLGNQFISFLASLRWDKRFSDVETCYKMVRRTLIDEIAPTLQEKRFGVELELTAKLARKEGVRFVERPIRYAGRSYAEGKKIGWRDGISAMRCILKY